MFFEDIDNTGDRSDPIAIIGIACRFPDADNYQAFWDNLEKGINSIKVISQDRWDINTHYSPDIDAPNKSLSQWCGLIENINQFDNRFFNISPREAQNMDPQQRLLLEETWHCIEDAGVSLNQLQKKITSVYVGVLAVDYKHAATPAEAVKDSYSFLGNNKSILANRLSYTYGLNGESISINAACAASHVALHQAKRSLILGESDYALAAGVNLNIHPWKYISISKARMLSPDGQCKTFDKDANGYVPGDGVAVILLQPLNQAIKDGNHIYGVIKGSAVNHGGRSKSITAPRVIAQRDVILAAYYEAKFSTETVNYVEAHGTGTLLGDPIEIEALTRAFRFFTDKKQFCHIGSVKTNIGHLEGAAGIAGIIKVLLMMQHQKIPRSLNVKTLNPIIDFDSSPFKVAVQAVDWEPLEKGMPLRAGISAFGFGGINSHFLIEKYEERLDKYSTPSAPMTKNAFLFILSTNSAPSLERLIKRWQRFVDTPDFKSASLDNICATLMLRKTNLPFRFACILNNREDLPVYLKNLNIGYRSDNPDRWCVSIGEFSFHADEYGHLIQQIKVFKEAIRQCEKSVSLLIDSEFSVTSLSKPSLSESEKQIASFILGYAWIKTLDYFGFKPTQIRTVQNGLWIGLAVAGMISYQDVLAILLKKEDWRHIRLTRPQIAFWDPVAQKEIQPYFFNEAYLSRIVDRIHIDDLEYSSYVEKAQVLRQGQYSFRRNIDAWAVLLKKYGIDIEAVLNSKARGSHRNEKTIIMLVIMSSLRQLSQTWELTEQPLRLAEEFYELLALLDDEVLTKEGCVELLINAQPSYVSIAQALNAKQENVNPDNSYHFLKQQSRFLPEIPDVVEWLKKSLRQEKLEDITDLGCFEVGDHADFPSDLKKMNIKVHNDAFIKSPYNLVQLVYLWLQYVDIKWDKLSLGRTFQKVRLPKYPFETRSFWWTRDHEIAWTNQNLPYRRKLLSSDPMIHNHIIDGKGIIPGAGMISMALDGLQKQDAKVTGLVEINMLNPGIVSKQIFVAVEIDRHHQKVLVKSDQAVLCIAAYQEISIHSLLRIDLSQIRNQPSIDIHEFYPTIALAGYQYGAELKIIRNVKQIGGGWFIELQKTALDEGNTAGINVGLLDGVFQTIVVIEYLKGRFPQKDILYIPNSIASLQLHRQLLDDCWVYIAENNIERLKNDIQVDIQVYDNDGQIIADIHKLIYKQVSVNFLEQHTQAARLQAGQIFSYKPVWRQAPSPVLNESDRTTPAIILFDSRKTELMTLNYLFRNYRNCFWVSLGSRFNANADGSYEIGTDNEADYVNLLGHIRAHKKSTSQDVTVFYLGAIEPNPMPAMNVFELSALQEGGLRRLLYLFKAIVRSHYKNIKTVIATCDCQVVKLEDSGVGYGYAGLAGLAQSIMAENPRIAINIVDLSQFQHNKNSTLAHIVNEIPVQTKPPLTAYRQGLRYLRYFEPLKTEENKTFSNLVKKGGVYLLIGGTGGIGFHTAETLIKMENIKLALLGRSTFDDDQQARIEKLNANGSQVQYFRGDIGNPNEMALIIQRIKEQLGPLNGIVHLAGVLDDGFLVNKDWESFKRVLHPKVSGTWCINEVTRKEPLDFFIVFSSVLSLLGNYGQCDYTAANSFVDAFVHYRMQNDYPGLSLSVNWPLWEKTGMAENSASEHIAKRLNIESISKPTGMQVLKKLFQMPVQGQLAIFGNAMTQIEPTALEVASAAGRKPSLPVKDRKTAIEKELLDLIALKLGEQKANIDRESSFFALGMESIIIMEILHELNKKYRDLSQTLLFEYPNIEELAEYLATQQLREEPTDKPSPDAKFDDRVNGTHLKSELNVDGAAERRLPEKEAGYQIAVIGMDGRFPHSPTLDAFWNNLVQGVDCIDVIPQERFAYTEYFDANPENENATYCKWGGFIEDADKFDPLFFNISPREAKLIDPQQRLFLETVWHTMENGGYGDRKLYKHVPVGLFVGVMWNEYSLISNQAGFLKNRFQGPGSLYWAIANRASYFMDFSGPSLAIDTACSSSLIAIHMACKSILGGECQMAVAGGVNLSIHPSKYIYLSQAKFLSTDGRCRSFGAGGDGYVPGEGVGAVLLKPLARALEDGDYIHGIIRGTSTNHGGKATGFTVPNPKAQADLILQGLERAQITPDQLGYIECHGTGTALGDPIEILGLSMAFSKYTTQKQFCPIGSVKSNIGHLEAASGIAGVIKILLCLQNKKIPVSLHHETLNSEIDFKKTPFFPVSRLMDWESPPNTSRIAGISSFGAGGSNAHLILEAAPDVLLDAANEALIDPDQYPGIYLFVLSARNTERLKIYAADIISYLKTRLPIVTHKDGPVIQRDAIESEITKIAARILDMDRNEIFTDDSVLEIFSDPMQLQLFSNEISNLFQTTVLPGYFENSPNISTLALHLYQEKTSEAAQASDKSPKTAKIDPIFNLLNIAYTMQVGRSAMDNRLAVVATDIPELVMKLQAYLDAPGQPKDVYTGNVKRDKEKAALILDGDTGAVSIDFALQKGALHKLAQFWVAGLTIDWTKLYQNQRPKRVPLPSYPFERQRYWLEGADESDTADPKASPLLTDSIDWVQSAAQGVVFRIAVDPADAIVKDHIVRNQAVLPAAAYVEFASRIFRQISPRSAISLTHLNWLTPLVIDKKQTLFVHTRADQQRIRFTVKSQAEQEQHVHAQGTFHLKKPSALKRKQLSLATIKDTCCNQLRAADVYDFFKMNGIQYGPDFRYLKQVWSDGQEACLALLKTAVVNDVESQFHLAHPGMLDGAFQAVGALLKAYGATETLLPFSVEKIEAFQLPPEEAYAYVQRIGSDRFDISLLDKQGRVCIRFDDMAFRVLQDKLSDLLYEPQWLVQSPREITARIQKPEKQTRSLIIYSKTQSAIGNTFAEQVYPSQAIRLIFGDQNQKHGGTVWEVKIGDSDALDTFFEGQKADQPPFDFIHFLNGLDSNDQALNHPYILEDIQERSVLTLFRLFKSLSQKGFLHKSLTLIVLTNNAVRVMPDDTIHPFTAAVYGLCKTASREYPQVSIVCVDIDRESMLTDTTSSIAKAVFQATALGNDQDTAIRQGRVYLRELIPVRIPPLVPPSTPFKSKATYVIIGGGGGIGLAFADYLAASRQVNLVLIGRSVLDGVKKRAIAQIKAKGSQVLYLRADVTDEKSLKGAVAKAKAAFGVINGAVYSAVVLKDGIIDRMDEATFKTVLASKVTGSVDFYTAFKDEPLDFMLFFSSANSFFGNAGQANYVAGSTFQDAFALYLNSIGKFPVKVINWGYWGHVGVAATESYRKKMAAQGFHSLGTAEGMEIIERFLGLSIGQAKDQVIGFKDQTLSQIVAMKAAPKVLQRMGLKIKIPNETPGKQEQAAIEGDGENAEGLQNLVGRDYAQPKNQPASRNQVMDSLVDRIVKKISRFLDIDVKDIDTDTPFAEFGVDSVIGVDLVNKINEMFDISLRTTAIFDYTTVDSLASYIYKEYSAQIKKQVSFTEELPPETPAIPSAMAPDSVLNPVVEYADWPPKKDIAVIGMAGRFPGAANVTQFWQNLSEGKSAIREIPGVRWPANRFYDPDPGNLNTTNCKYGGFLDDIDQFDPLFFKISGAEAELTDPQQRLFLEECWNALEDAGYAHPYLSGKKCGVFVGIGPSYYMENLKENRILRKSQAFWGNESSIAPARISYVLNLKGPNIAVNTACSSSLVAVHLACQSIRLGESELAIAGGVYIATNPDFYILSSNAGMLSADGKCKTFDNAADGFVPGEGVGAVIVKSLEAALKEGDHIYGIIKGSGMNQDGRTNGITAPSMESQKALELSVYEKFAINPATISYVEAHGTGTKLGDPIEIEALCQSFGEYSQQTQYCAIGSVKTNIGHGIMAAGVAGLIKVLLCLKHQKIPPSLNYQTQNEHIDFKNSPFFVNTQLRDWNDNIRGPRRAAISSFGFSGTNCHLVIEEAPPSVADNQQKASIPLETTSLIFILSANNTDRLKAYAKNLIHFLKQTDSSLNDIGYTLQVGREAMAARLAVVAVDKIQLIDKLNKYLQGDETVEALYQGIINTGQKHSALMENRADAGDMIGRWVKEGKHAKLAEIWVAGMDIDWKALYGGTILHRISLPTYPFARERYWFEVAICDEPRSAISLPRQAESSQREIKTAYYKEVWQPEAKGDRNRRDIGAVLLFDISCELRDALSSMLKTRRKNTVTIILIKQGNAFEVIDDTTCTINISHQDDYRNLFKYLIRKEIRPDGVLVNQTAIENSFFYKDAEKALERSVSPVYQIVKCLLDLKLSTIERFLYLFKASSDGADPFMASVSAFGQSLKRVVPKLRFSTVSITDIQNSVVAEAVLNELEAGEVFNEINYVKGERFIRQPVPVEIIRKSKLPFKTKGVYLITGGLGGLGLIVARYLGKQFGARLILTGRSPLSPEKQAQVEDVRRLGSAATYYQADITDFDTMQKVITNIKKEYGALNGVFHAAGSVNVNQITDKDIGEFNSILKPKISGTLVLDEITKNENLDLFVLFSSTSAVLGDFGQCDYAVGNRFMDAFGRLRTIMAAHNRRWGQTFTINWPLWREGGMHLNEEGEKLYLKSSGMEYLETPDGLEALEAILESKLNRILVIRGDQNRFTEYLKTIIGHSTSKTPATREALKSVKRTVNTLPAHQRLENDLRKIAATLLKIDPDRINSEDNFSNYGFESITLKDYAERLSSLFQIDLLPTVFFKQSNIKGLAAYILEAYKDSIFNYYSDFVQAMQPNMAGNQGDHTRLDDDHADKPSRSENESYHGRNSNAPIAIIGAHGVFPGARDLDEFWQNLVAGKNMISLIPKERWDWQAFYDETNKERTKTNSKWGGFISDVDKFDCRFFNISPAEAEVMDPQHRIMLEVAWKAVEDSGYKPSALAGQSVGVFVGVQFNDFQEILTKSGNFSAHMGTGNSHAILANRISYCMNFNGPSESIDTACSSSLVAVHHAVTSIRNGESTIALAGGVSLILSPSSVVGPGKLGVLSPDGRCKTFDKDANGYVKGEGCGVVVLKPLKQAQSDNDPIYAVIKGSAVNHGGKANSLTAPNSEAQAALLFKVYDEAGLSPSHISYIEAHGTGTELGDPVEIEGLLQAFSKLAQKRNQPIEQKQYCGIGSVKTNIGHLEPAAGIAGLMKIILAMKHEILPGTLHVEEVNPLIRLKDTPFYIVRQTQRWEPPVSDAGRRIPRLAGVSSFGFGGAYAHVVLEAYSEREEGHQNQGAFELPQHVPTDELQTPVVIVLSAKDAERLRAYAGNLLSFLNTHFCQTVPAQICNRKQAGGLMHMAYTLQTGRKGFNRRLAVVVTSVAELTGKLERYCNGEGNITNLYEGEVKGRRQMTQLIDGAEGREFVRIIINEGKLDKLAQLWVGGIEIDWRILYPEHTPCRIPLPTYPFARRHFPLPEIVPALFYHFQTGEHVDTGDIAGKSTVTAEDPSIVIEGQPTEELRPLSVTSAGNEMISTRDRPIGEVLRADIRLVLENDLINRVSQILKLDIEEIDVETDMQALGFESITLTQLSDDLNATYTLEITPALFFELDAPNIKALAKNLAESHTAVLSRFYQGQLNPEKPIVTQNVSIEKTTSRYTIESDAGFFNTPGDSNCDRRPGDRSEDVPVAVIGMSGVMPQSDDLETFWRHLENGNDLISEVPKDRWDWKSLLTEDTEKAKWGGFLKEIDKFDPLFFGISPREATLMDPQQRIFLEIVWKTIEDAGYKPSALSGTKTGLFAGVSTMDYFDLAKGAGDEVDAYLSTGSSHSILTNRISYFLNLHGPSEPIDTACSSSLVAIHRAVEAIQRNNCDMAIAGGINLLVSPVLFLSFNAAGMIGADGRCKTFDKDADGYVRGEGAGAVFLKPLNKAVSDRDHIYGIIKGTAENHGGRANSLTAPSAKAQTDLLVEVYTRAKIDPATVSYIEAHGTGTSLGDPVEINGLKKAFAILAEQNGTQLKEGSCGVGSVKTNIGHLETAAGIAGVIKVLLSMKHQKIPASLHLKTLNPYIKLEGSPFFIVNEARPWTVNDNTPRRAGVSSFGFGGANAHVIIEEFKQSAASSQVDPPYVFVLSAKNPDRLKAYVSVFNHFLAKTEASPADIAYTLQVGREAMDERLAVAVSDKKQLIKILSAFLKDKIENDGVFQGNAKTARKRSRYLENDDDAKEMISRWIDKGRQIKLAEIWVEGIEFDWAALYGDQLPKRISLPTYPFDRKRYWIATVKQPVREPHGIAGQITRFASLHPLVGSNISTINEQQFKTTLSGNEFFLTDHVILDQKVLPGVAYIEMARAAGVLSGYKRIQRIKNIAWLKPISVSEQEVDVFITLRASKGFIHFEVFTTNQSEKREKHCQGKLVIEKGKPPMAGVVDVNDLKKRCGQSISGEKCYARFKRSGFQYGTAFQSIKDIYHNKKEAFSILQLPSRIKDDFDDFLLHPSLMDGALQTVSAMITSDKGDNQTILPFSIGEVDVLHPLQPVCYAYATVSDEKQSADKGTLKYHVRLLDNNGQVLVHIKDFTIRPITIGAGRAATSSIHIPQAADALLYFQEKWIPEDIDEAVSASPAGPIILFDVDARLHAGMIEKSNDQSMIYLVLPGQNYLQIKDGVYQIQPDTAGDYLRLLQAINKQTERAPQIIHFWSRLPESNLYKKQARSAHAARISTVGFYSVFYLTQALFETYVQKQVQVLYSFIADASGHSFQSSLDAAVGGFAKTVMFENSKFIYRTISFEYEDVAGNENQMHIEPIVDALLKELTSMDKTASEVRYQQSKRYITSYEVLQLPDIISNDTDRLSDDTIALKENGVYLLTGGTGGLGLIFAKHLAKTVRARLILSGRTALNDAIQSRVTELGAYAADVTYIRTDVADRGDVENLFQQIKKKFGTINGIIHSAGTKKDALIIKKTVEEIESVAAAKIHGTLNLDDVTKDEPMDFMVLFSSTSAVFGNIGQSDYAFVNRFLDNFAQARNLKRSDKKRFGKTISINWPLWQDGGMQIDEQFKKWIKKSAGMTPLPSREGIKAFTDILAAPLMRIMPLYGEQEKIAGLFQKKIGPKERARDGIPSGIKLTQAPKGQKQKIIKDLIAICTDALEVDHNDIDVDTNLSEYGVDSIMMMDIINRLEERYGYVIAPDVLVSYRTINAISDYLIEERIVSPEEEISLPEVPSTEDQFVSENIYPDGRQDETDPPAESIYPLDRQAENADYVDQRIAVIGMACRFPQSESAHAFWNHISNGDNLIVDIPAQRWNFWHANRPGSDRQIFEFPKFGGFIDNIDYFDAAYFGIKENDAEVMDPKQRIMLELAQELFVDAGYTNEEITNSNTAIWLGAGYSSSTMTDSYLELKEEHRKHMMVNIIPNMMAARISDFFNLKGAAQTVDTACSSSLVAIHQACLGIRSGESDMAIAGGIDLLLNDYPHYGFHQAQVLTDQKQAYIFDKRAKGFILGEGAGIVLLKSYQKALADGDRILGVILGSAINNDGHTMGLTVPNIDAQKEVIRAAIGNSKVNPITISLLEAHGTGTLLGDPIEIRAATQVFRDYTDEKGFCGVGSVKSNVGHLLRAAGAAGFLKVILALQHKEIPPTINCDHPHPRFKFDSSPFYPVTTRKRWLPVQGVWRAGISSFGFGGTNCHMIIEGFGEEETEQQMTGKGMKRKPLPPVQFKRKRYAMEKNTDASEPADEAGGSELDERFQRDLLKKLYSGEVVR